MRQRSTTDFIARREVHMIRDASEMRPYLKMNECDPARVIILLLHR